MAETLLEQTRALHEDVERLERVVVKDLKQETKSHKDKLMQSHRVRKRLGQIQEASHKLIKIYEDDDKARKEEIEALGGEDKVFTRFYDRLKEVREYHRRFPNPDLTEAEDSSALLKEEPHVEFTGEEGLGRYLDLHDLFLRFHNSKLGPKQKPSSKADADGEAAADQGPGMEYHEYVTGFANFASIPRGAKNTKAYREYLAALLGYLTSFYQRTQPLAQLTRTLNKVEEDFGPKWEAGSVVGWEDRGLGLQPAASSSGSTGIMDLDVFDSAQEVEMLGSDRLKEALQALGLKCGGTMRERAERLWLTKSTPLDQIDRKHFAKGVAPPSSVSAEDAARQQANARQAAVLEAKVSKMAEMLSSVIADTKGRVEKKQAQTYEEMQAELAEAEAEAMAEDDEEDEFIYNPLKLPLGWDGKPIPYWLYKLHGLNMEFKCEICGNYSYWGRRAYEKHFKEFRHQNGMRALGIPNNKAFYEVTKIDEALSLWKSMQAKGVGNFKVEDEEFEDDSGNVYNKKTYEDLKRQGLI